MTETWQYTLQSIFQDNIVIPLKNGKWNEFDLMKYFVNNVHVRKRILLWFCNLEHSGICNKKNMQKSEELRQNGNKEFQNKNYSLSIKFYTMSLQYAPLESENLPLALANRSAALFRLEKYQGCIKDIELALKHNYPKNMVYKLYIRSAQCYMKLHKKDLMEESLFRLHQCLENGNILISNKRDYHADFYTNF